VVLGELQPIETCVALRVRVLLVELARLHQELREVSSVALQLSA
jgi:hypothetical protein